jgi:hypothetical protein
MKLEGNGHKGEERRKTPIVIKLTMREYVAFLFPTIGAVFLAIVWWANMNTKTEALAETDALMKVEVAKNTEVNQKQNEDIVRLQTDVTHTKNDVGEMKGTINKIWDKISNGDR